jgi:GcrA cell cycle regulator
MSWTDDRVETLKRMWTEGQSASQIAKELGGVTRNAVMAMRPKRTASTLLPASPTPRARLPRRRTRWPPAPNPPPRARRNLAKQPPRPPAM